MSAEERIKEALGDARSPSRGLVEARPMIEESGTPEAKIRALEHDVTKLREALLVAAAEISKVGGSK